MNRLQVSGSRVDASLPAAGGWAVALRAAQVARSCLAVLVFTVVLAGCAGYQLGSTLPPGIKSVCVPTFINTSGEPQVETEATSAAIREFQRDGTLQIRNEDDADTILFVTVTSLDLIPKRYQKDKPKTAQEYRLRIVADLIFAETAVARRIAAGKELDSLEKKKYLVIRRTVEGEYDFEPAGNLSSAKREFLPQACNDLAHDIVECVSEYWYTSPKESEVRSQGSVIRSRP